MVEYWMCTKRRWRIAGVVALRAEGTEVSVEVEGDKHFVDEWVAEAIVVDVEIAEAVGDTLRMHCVVLGPGVGVDRRTHFWFACIVHFVSDALHTPVVADKITIIVDTCNTVCATNSSEESGFG